MWSKAFHGQETMKEQDELQIAASLRSSQRRELRFSTHDCAGLCPSTASRRGRPTPTGDRRSPPVCGVPTRALSAGVLRKTPARSRMNCSLPRRCAPGRRPSPTGDRRSPPVRGEDAGTINDELQIAA